MSETHTSRCDLPCLGRIRNKQHRFIATKLERHPYGIEVRGQWRTGPGGHHYPDQPASYVWPWREVQEIREGVS